MSKPIEYRSTDLPRTPNPVTWAVAGGLIGFFATPPALVLALVSAGSGHGHYEFARGLFPIIMLATRFTGNHIGAPLILAALLQFPIFGSATGFFLARRQFLWPALMIIAHFIAVVACFSGVVPNFS